MLGRISLMRHSPYLGAFLLAGGEKLTMLIFILLSCSREHAPSCFFVRFCYNAVDCMTQSLSAKIRNGKIVLNRKLSIRDADVKIKIFVFRKAQKVNQYFGKCKGAFGDGLVFQKKMREEWIPIF